MNGTSKNTAEIFSVQKLFEHMVTNTSIRILRKKGALKIRVFLYLFESKDKMTADLLR